MVLNFKHLRYFWMVAKAGSIVRASEQLHLTPHSISAQLTTLEESLGVKLFQRAGRNIELTETGRSTLRYADEIFTMGDELLDMLHKPSTPISQVFKVGIADVVPKSVAYRLVEPSLHLAEPVRLICREGPLDSLLSELAVNRIDMVIADRAMPASMNVRAYNHFLGESGLSVLATSGLAATLNGDFPACLDQAPMLLPGADVAMRPQLLQWFGEQGIRPRIVGEFDDSALLKAFGQAGSGVFVTPTFIAHDVCSQYGVQVVGCIESVREHLYAITTQRRLTHPIVVAVSEAARKEVFGKVAKPTRPTSKTRIKVGRGHSK